jgi:hypothetical protein
MYDVAHGTLYNMLDNGIQYDQTSGQPLQHPDDFFPSVLLHAWAMVDAANRLDLLLQHTYGLPRREARFKEDHKKLKVSKKLRNPIQHLNKEITNRAANAEVEPVWGSLSWGRLLSVEPHIVHRYVLLPGSLEPTIERPFHDIYKPFHNKIDPIELTAYGSTISLSEVYTAIANLTTLLEKGLQTAIEADERFNARLGAELILRMKFSQDYR